MVLLFSLVLGNLPDFHGEAVPIFTPGASRFVHESGRVLQRPNPKSATERPSYETAAFPAAWDDSFARPGVVSGSAQARRSSSALRITRSVRSFDGCAILADSFFVFAG